MCRSAGVLFQRQVGARRKGPGVADKPLLNLDADGRWRLASDRQQWIIQRRTQKPRVRRLEGHAISDTGWRGVSFVGGKKATVERLFREKGIVLTPEAQKQLDALPNEFRVFLVEPSDLSPPVAPRRAA